MIVLFIANTAIPVLVPEWSHIDLQQLFYVKGACFMQGVHETWDLSALINFGEKMVMIFEHYPLQQLPLVFFDEPEQALDKQLFCLVCKQQSPSLIDRSRKEVIKIFYEPMGWRVSVALNRQAHAIRSKNGVKCLALRKSSTL